MTIYSRLAGCLVIGLFFTIYSGGISAQVIPDGTTNTIVDTNDNNFNINQGDRAGNNLFHSFTDFSLPNGGTAFFNNTADIANIFSRVTGGNISDINGLIHANGAANLFIINPAGIIFGENSSLDIGGSFYASTADSILFPNNVEFNATEDPINPLLTINAPIGLNLGDNPGDIVNRSTVRDSAEEVIGLEVNPGNNLTFVASNLNFEGGSLTAIGGDIYLSAISESGTVEISENGSLSFAEDISRGDITLSNGSEVDVRGFGGGNIQVDVGNLNLEGGELGISSIRAGIREESTAIEAQVGDITIDAKGNLSLNEGEITNNVELEGFGNSGNVLITTDSLSLLNGGLIATITRGQGDAGAVNVTATGDITIDGERDVVIDNGEDSFILARASGITSRVFPEGVGNSGGVTVSTTNLNLTAGGRVDAGVGGQGDAGAVNVTATGDITIDGEISRGIPSQIASRINSDAVGDAAGVTVSTTNLNLTAGGRVDATTAGQGNAGAVNVTATGDITIDGERLLNTSSRGAPSGITSEVIPIGEGDAGDVIIFTNSLNLTNGGEVSASTGGQGNAGNITIDSTESVSLQESLVQVDSQGDGNGGNININTHFLELSDQGIISAITASGNGGNINLSIEDRVYLNNSSLISTQALVNGNGGNINIDSNFVIAFADGNSDIVANALSGNGGRIEINTQALFGIESREELTGENDINASSEFGLDGLVKINTFEIDLTPGLTELPTAFAIPQPLQGCQASRESEDSSSFVNTGRGGLPPNPYESLNNNNVFNDVQLPSQWTEKSVVNSSALLPEQESVVEANTWVVNREGNVELVANSMTTTVLKCGDRF